MTETITTAPCDGKVSTCPDCELPQDDNGMIAWCEQGHVYTLPASDPRSDNYTTTQEQRRGVPPAIGTRWTIAAGTPQARSGVIVDDPDADTGYVAIRLDGLTTIGIYTREHFLEWFTPEQEQAQ